MVDRGGLNYPIRVRDEFSKTTALFRKELGASKKAFRDFQKTVKGNKSAAKDIRDQAKATRELTKAQNALGTATKRTVKPMTDEEKVSRSLSAQHKRQARQLAALAKAQRERERTAIALRNAQNADLRREKARLKTIEREAKASRKAAQAKNVEVQARKRNAAAAFREAVALKQVEQLKRRAASQFKSGDILGGTRTLRNARDLEKTLKKTKGTAQRLLFTFRRLVGALAIFTLARKGAQAFNDMLKTGIKFNDTVATSQLGIAGLVATLGDVRDAQGQSVTATEELNLALGIARQQTALLRQDSLRTVATFEQLLDTFQVSVGPGLAAGLNLDEVRQLTVDISQAASALGVPQNQLAEEVRSLLSGTIQARTTRIATALGISNADIKRLKEAGTLFDFLEDKFQGFGEAAERTARETFKGITTLIKGLVQEILGNAAKPLFDELIALGNDLFDNFLSITDAAGNIKPSPAVVAAFQQVFDSIKRSVEAMRELGNSSALSLLDTGLGAVAVTIDFISGAAVALISAFTTVAEIVQDIGEFFGATSENAGSVARTAGKWLVNILLIKKAIGFINLKMISIVARAAPAAAAFFAIAKAVEFVLEKIFGIDLGIRDTIQLITVGLYSAWIGVATIVQTVALKSVTFMENALDSIITAAKNKASQAKAFLSALFGDAEGSQAAAKAAQDREFASEQRIAKRKRDAALEVADIENQAKAKQKGLEEEIAKIVANRAAKNAQGEGFRSGFDPKTAAEQAAEAAETFVSTADKPISKLGEELEKINDELIKSEALFRQSGRAAQEGAIGGLAGSVTAEFDKEEIANAERLRQLKVALADTERQINELRAEGVEDTSGAIVSALRDEVDLKDAIALADEVSLKLAALKAATLANKALPAIREESAALAAQVAAERAKTAAVVGGTGQRELALQAAQSALDVAEQELAATVKKNDAEQDALQAQAAKLPPGEELDALNAVIEALGIRQGFEEEILRLRTEQLKKAKEEAELVANGTMTEGLKEGFAQFAEQFSSTFQAGINIAQKSLQAFTSFASQAIVDAFDPTKDSQHLKQQFARLMQSIAQTILQELIQLAIAKAILGFKDGGVVPDINTPGVGGFAKGGKVPDHYSRRAQGLARGGRPDHIPASDTVPAWLTPGEFVMNKAATSQFLPQLESMNGGNMAVVGSASAEAAGPTSGMAGGGQVSDQLASAAQGSGGGDTTVLPVLVARDGEMDRLTAGGKNAMLAFMSENAGNINSLLDRSNRQG